jgi:SAM-dependent methyltransferase
MEAFTKDKSVGWYDERPNETQLTPAARELLENYSNIPADKVEDHVVNIHNEAWEIFPYPCIGQFRFLDLSLRKFEEYPEVLKRLQEGQRLLDLGCCFGQEVRQLVADGAPAENIFGCDLREEYITLGYKLFCDEDTLKSTFITANIFDATSPLTALKGQFDMVFAGSFFHLWGYEDQVKVYKLVVGLLRPQ